MKNKIVGIILTVLIFAIPLGITIYKGQSPAPNNPDTEKVVYTNIFTPVSDAGISGPKEAAIGELVRMQVKGEQVKWSVLPPIADLETFGQSNEKAVASFRRNGEYVVIAATVADGKVGLETLKINIGGVVVPAPTPDNPNPTPINSSVDADLVAKVRTWATEGRVNKAQAAKLAANFRQVATETQSGKLASTGEIINRTAALNQSLDLKGFDGVMARIQAYLTQQADSGVLATPEQHVTVWFSIASGLESFNEPSGSKK